MTGLSVEISAKHFGSRHVLGEVRFDIAAGERVALLGPSGIGKSTLLSLISGSDTSFGGRIDRPGGRIAMVFQTPRLLPWRTLAQNIEIIPGAKGARALLASVGLADAVDQYPEKVSLGMQRRAALARAMAVQPSLILMDEPLVSLDPASATEMRRLLTDTMDRTGAATLIATHDRREALMLADRVLMMDGPPARLVSDRRSPLGRDVRQQADAVIPVQAEWFGANG
ncbi:MAG: ATP-binding cassette domain-containing protein [Paracoccaceae bacterium]